MPNLPSQIPIFNFQIQTFGIFVLLGFLIFSFVIWSEGRKDGFDEEKLFDLLLIVVTSTILVSRLIFAASTSTSGEDFFNRVYRVWEQGYNLSGALFGFIVPVFVLCKLWKWSVYRILDIFSLGASLGFSITLLGYVGLQAKFEFLFAFAAWIFLYSFLSRFRNFKVKSGYAFSLFLTLNTALGLVFFRNRDYLIFYMLMVTLSLVVFLFRWRLGNNGESFIKRISSKIKSAALRKKE